MNTFDIQCTPLNLFVLQLDPNSAIIWCFRYELDLASSVLSAIWLYLGNWKSREREAGTEREREWEREREIVLGSSPRFPNEYITSQGRLGTRLL